MPGLGFVCARKGTPSDGLRDSRVLIGPGHARIAGAVADSLVVLPIAVHIIVVAVDALVVRAQADDEQHGEDAGDERPAEVHLAAHHLLAMRQPVPSQTSMF